MSAYDKAFRVSNVNGFETEVITFIQSKLMMPPESIKLSLNFADYVYFTHTITQGEIDSLPFTVSVITLPPIVYYNISGQKLEIPVSVINGHMTYQKVNAGTYLVVTDYDAKNILNDFIRRKLLKQIGPIRYLLGEDGTRVNQQDDLGIIL